MMVENSAGSTLTLELSLSRTSLVPDSNRLSTELGVESVETRSANMDEARPEPYENSTMRLPANSPIP